MLFIVHRDNDKNNFLVQIDSLWHLVNLIEEVEQVFTKDALLIFRDVSLNRITVSLLKKVF